MRRIDAHQHFWQLGRGDYSWLTPSLAPIYRDFMPFDLAPILARHGVEGTVLVQAAPSDAETDFMLSLAEENASIEGVVGWVDLAHENARQRIAALADHPKLKGLRPMIQDIADDDWMLRPDLEPAFQALIDHGLAFDALVLPRHLGNLLALLSRHPRMRVVVDHCAKPEIARRAFDGWARDIERIAVQSSALCKLSGLVTEAGDAWTVEGLRPYVEHVLSCFGAERVIWGSDWPVCTLAAGYDEWIAATEELLSARPPGERDAILGGNAVSFYRL